MIRPALLLGVCLSLPVSANAEPVVIPLWPEGVPDAQKDAGAEYIEDNRVYNVQVPTLTCVPAPADKANSTLAILCPGGSYTWLSIINESTGHAKWLNAAGVSVFIP